MGVPGAKISGEPIKIVSIEGIYKIGAPDEKSPALVTTNFALTFFFVSGEIEGSRVPSWLLIRDSEGLSVLTAWAAGKFAGDDVGMFVKKCGIMDKVKNQERIIPGYAASIVGDIEKELPGWNIIVGPREAAHIPGFPNVKRRKLHLCDSFREIGVSAFRRFAVKFGF